MPLRQFWSASLPVCCRFVLSMRQSQIPIVRFNVLPFIGLQVPSTTNCQVSPSIVNDSDQLSINRLNQSITATRYRNPCAIRVRSVVDSFGRLRNDAKRLANRAEKAGTHANRTKKGKPQFYQ